MNPTDEHHSHRWRIAEVSGSTSPGVCQTCGMERDFQNWTIGSEALARAQAGLPPIRLPASPPSHPRRQPRRAS